MCLVSEKMHHLPRTLHSLRGVSSLLAWLLFQDIHDALVHQVSTKATPKLVGLAPGSI
jgi:hypothetical protein